MGGRGAEESSSGKGDAMVSSAPVPRVGLEEGHRLTQLRHSTPPPRTPYACVALNLAKDSWRVGGRAAGPLCSDRTRSGNPRHQSERDSASSAVAAPRRPAPPEEGRTAAVDAAFKRQSSRLSGCLCRCGPSSPKRKAGSAFAAAEGGRRLPQNKGGCGGDPSAAFDADSAMGWRGGGEEVKKEDGKDNKGAIADDAKMT